MAVVGHISVLDLQGEVGVSASDLAAVGELVAAIGAKLDSVAADVSIIKGNTTPVELPLE